jgi:hypothetical protein
LAKKDDVMYDVLEVMERQDCVMPKRKLRGEWLKADNTEDGETFGNVSREFETEGGKCENTEAETYDRNCEQRLVKLYKG